MRGAAVRSPAIRRRVSVRAMLCMVAALAIGSLGTHADAHEVRPALLGVRQKAPDLYEVIWKQPVLGDMAVHLVPHLSNGWLEQPPTEELFTPTYRIRTWSIRTAALVPLSEQTLSVEGLDRTITDVLVSVTLSGRPHFEAILRPLQPSLVLDRGPPRGLAVPAYFRLGVEHILTGVDHLAFVLGLLLMTGIEWRLIKAVTAFTVAHSVTLGASALGFVHAPTAIVEALVALSVVFVACEVIGRDRGRVGLTARHPWIVAFVFGLLHGFAFAGALADVGLPTEAIPASLLLFNLGVEVGQLLFVAAAIIAMLGMRQLLRFAPASWTAFTGRIPPYTIGILAVFWFLERTWTAFGVIA